MYKIDIKGQAYEDLEKIKDYTFRFSFSLSTADRIIDEIMGKILSLKIFPYLYPTYNSEYRVMTVRKKYKVFYKVTENKKLVEIYYVFGAEEDYDSIIH